MSHRDSVSCIVPPHILMKLVEGKNRRLRELALDSLLSSAQIRAQRNVMSFMPMLAGAGGGGKRRTIFDALHLEPFPRTGTRVRSEGDAPVSDVAVNEAYDGLGTTYDFYHRIFQRNSLDDNGMRLDAYVHFGDGFGNAFWDGQQMVFGDGDEELFTGFTKSLDVIAHELTHGVTEFSAGLKYEFQPGALNESMSDVFGSLVKQWSLGQDARSADWLVGAEVFTPDIPGDALRSLKAPGEAYDNDLIGKDPQPKHMSGFKVLPNTRQGDWGGVHINSGIPNHAFYLLATDLGGNAWEAPGQIWYETLTKNSGTDAKFQDFADATHGVAGRLFGPGSVQQVAVREAWREVGIRVTGGGSIGPASSSRTNAPPASGAESSYDVEASIRELHDKLNALAKVVESLSKKKS